MNDLRKDDSIIITRPDKGNGVVIINKLDYLNKMKQLISDETKFKKLARNPTTSYFVSGILSFRHTLFPAYFVSGILCRAKHETETLTIFELFPFE